MSTVSDFVVQRLQAWGVTRVFGYPGDGIGEFDGAMGRAQRDGQGLQYIRPTHEEICALMATAHAKFTGEVGVCVATSSPGAFHLLNGLYDAQMDNQPVVAIVGQQGLDSLGTFTMQENNLERVLADVACYVQTIVSPQQAQAVVDTAFRTAKTRLQPAVVILPHDVQAMDMVEPGQEHWVSRSSVGAPSSQFTPPLNEILRAAELLNHGERVGLLVGHGATGATDEVLQVAQLTGAGIITALRGKQVVPGDIPHHTQQLGLLGSRASRKIATECDTLLMLGTNYPYGEFLPATGQARCIQVDLRPEHIGLRYPADVHLWGDVKATLTALIPHLQDWSNPQLVIVVMHNDDLTQVSWEMRTEDANPVWNTAQEVESVDYAGWAKLLGFQGIQVRTEEEVGPAWDAAFAHPGVTLIDAYVSKNVPPLPAHVSAEYAVNTAKALLKADPEQRAVIVGSAKAVVSEGTERLKDALHLGRRDHHDDDPSAEPTADPQENA